MIREISDSQVLTRKVIRICDVCHDEREVRYADLIKCRKNQGHEADYCLPCSRSVKIAGDKNPMNSEQTKRKMRETRLGRSKTYKDETGKGREVSNRVNKQGYIVKYKDGNKTPEHRVIMAKHLGRELSDEEIVHHIDGDKTNNLISNLLLTDKSGHGLLHSQLEELAFELVRKKAIIFDKSENRYLFDPATELAFFDVSLGFEDVAIKQNKNICKSRLDVDVSSEIIRGVIRPIPLIAANMSTVVSADFCIQLFKLGALGVMHRANDEDVICNDVRKIAGHCDWTAASIGIGDSQFKFAERLIRSGANILVIDVAHGFSLEVIELAKKLKKGFPHVKIVIGNTTNTQLLKETYEFVDAIKVGIATGFACETKNTAGCTEKQFSAVYKFRHLSKSLGVPIISDGGIREAADFVKAIGAGASSVMAGMIFARCPESAAELVQLDGQPGIKKLYAGMASRYVQEKWKGGVKEGTCTEGGTRLLELGESADKLLERYSGALRSGITYAGGRDIKSFQQAIRFIQV